MRVPGPGAVALAAGIAALVSGAAIQLRLRLRSLGAERDPVELLDGLRAAACEGGPLPADPGLPAVVTAWKAGRRAGAWQGSTSALADGIRRACDARLQLDLAVADGWLPDGGLAFALAFVEGRDGVSAAVGGTRVWVPPGNLVHGGVIGAVQPLGALEPGLRVGLSHEAALAAVGEQAAALGVRGEPADLRRFRARSAVEGASGEPRALVRGLVEKPALDAAGLRTAASEGADYLARSLRTDGRFTYSYDAPRNAGTTRGYVWARHAGTCYSLALAGRVLGERRWVLAAGTGLDRLASTLVDGPAGSACWKGPRACDTGTTALALLAMAEFRIASGDTRFDGFARRLAAFLRFMERPEGLFYHRWVVGRGDDRQAIDRKTMWPFASQQAVLALARHAVAQGEVGGADLAAARRGMDRLSGPYWDHFLSHWFVGQEAWTCIAAEELHALVPDREAARFCHEIGAFYARTTLGPTDTPFPEDIGGMGITHVVAPYSGATATVAEALVSAVRLGRAEGWDTSGQATALRDALGFLVRAQLGPDDGFWLLAPDRARGGIVEKATRLDVRIDTVQHAISAMVRATEGQDLTFDH